MLDGVRVNYSQSGKLLSNFAESKQSNHSYSNDK